METNLIINRKIENNPKMIDIITSKVICGKRGKKVIWKDSFLVYAIKF